MLTDLTNKENYIFLEAHPEYNDSVMSIEINTATNEFEICDGGGQHMDTIYKGTADYSVPNTLTLNYTHEQISETDLTHQITFIYTVTKQTTKHFNGYDLHISNNFVTFDRSLLTPPDHPTTAHQSDPLVFYTIDGEEECDTNLYRAKDRIQRFIKNKEATIPPEFAQHHNAPQLPDETLSKILELREEKLQDTTLELTTILGASERGLLLYYDDRAYFILLSPTNMKIYINQSHKRVNLEPKLIHTFEYANRDSEEVMKGMNTESVDVKEFVNKVTALFTA